MPRPDSVGCACVVVVDEGGHTVSYSSAAHRGVRDPQQLMWAPSTRPRQHKDFMSLPFCTFSRFTSGLSSERMGTFPSVNSCSLTVTLTVTQQLKINS